MGVCSCVTIGWAQRGSSRENVVSSEQFRSLPEGFRSDSRCELERGIERSGSTEPRLFPPGREVLELEATVLDAEVQEILGEGEGNGDELAGWFAASMGSSSRVPKCRETIRARLLGNSACGGCLEEGGRHLYSSSSCGCWPGFGNGRGPGRSALHRWTSGNRTSRGFLRCVVHRDSRRLRRPAGSNHRCSIWSNLVRSRQTAPTHSVFLSLLQNPTDIESSRKCSFIPYLDPRTDCAAH